MTAHCAEGKLYAVSVFSMADSGCFVPIAEDISTLAGGILVYYPGPLNGQTWLFGVCSG